MENINIWKLNETPYMDKVLNEINNILEKGNYLLDMNKQKYSILERYVYDIASFHLKRLNTHIESHDDIKNNYYIEFWGKSKHVTSVLHVDCGEELKIEQLEYKYPLLSSVTYLNDCNIPTVITNIDMDRYMYKDFEKDQNLFFSFPKKGKQITFDGKYYHGSAILGKEFDVSNEDRYIIAINLWDKPPTNVEYYSDTCEKEDDDIIIIQKDHLVYVEPEELTENNNIMHIGVDKDTMNYELFENILYKPENNNFTVFDNIINNYKESKNLNSHSIHNYRFFLNGTIAANKIQAKKLESQLKTKVDNILEDMNELMKAIDAIDTIDTIDAIDAIKINNRFLQRFIYPKIYCSNVCKWIINESEAYAENNGGWTKTRHVNYPTTDLPVKFISSISNFVFSSLEMIIKKIKTSYGLNNEIQFDFKDLFIVKYKHDEQNFLEMHSDGTIISFNILLSEQNDFEGGGTCFDDGLVIKSEQGDLIIHNGIIKHSGLPITQGTRYLLVGFAYLHLTSSENVGI
jgi:hypothetical protein